MKKINYRNGVKRNGLYIPMSKLYKIRSRLELDVLIKSLEIIPIVNCLYRHTIFIIIIIAFIIIITIIIVIIIIIFIITIIKFSWMYG